MGERGIRRMQKLTGKPIVAVDARHAQMAMCLAAVGDGLLKSRQPRDAMLRLEEAVGIYRGLLGPYHVNVSRLYFYRNDLSRICD